MSDSPYLSNKTLLPGAPILHGAGAESGMLIKLIPLGFISKVRLPMNLGDPIG
jgi:hypothetical protein